ncbi:MAG: hypothetical protein H0T73_22770 [Ardenticatenales bacterium]|nr:hypothetical protein [Ardenticatenales bacterium]
MGHENDSDKTKPIHTFAGTSDGIVGNGEPVSGKDGPETQERASDFYEEIGAAILGKEGEDVHGPDMEDDEVP